MLERHLTLVLITSHYHACYPEEDDIRTGYKVCGGVVVLNLFVVRLFYTVEQRDRPEPRAEPGIERTFILNVVAFRLGLGNDDLIVRVVLQTSLRQ